MQKVVCYYENLKSIFQMLKMLEVKKSLGEEFYMSTH